MQNDAERIAPEVLDELERLEKAAETPVPQEYDEPARVSLTFDHDHNVFPPLAAPGEYQVGGPTAVFSHPVDAALYVALRNATPALISAARENLAQRERIAELEGEVGRLQQVDSERQDACYRSGYDDAKATEESLRQLAGVEQALDDEISVRDQIIAVLSRLDDGALVSEGPVEMAERIVATTEKKIADVERRLLDQESAEAAVCPEDVGFAEYIKVLEARLADAEQARDRAIFAFSEQSREMGILDARLAEVERERDECRKALAVIAEELRLLNNRIRSDIYADPKTDRIWHEAADQILEVYVKARAARAAQGGTDAGV
jgi:hypothetical protein